MATMDIGLSKLNEKNNLLYIIFCFVLFVFHIQEMFVVSIIKMMGSSSENENDNSNYYYHKRGTIMQIW